MWNCCCEYNDPGMEDDCCPDWCENKRVKGRFGLAFVAETPCCCPEPIGWQVEFCDTPSKVEQRCKEMIQWANCPPLPRCEPCPPVEVCSPCYPPRCNPCCPISNPCPPRCPPRCTPSPRQVSPRRKPKSECSCSQQKSKKSCCCSRKSKPRCRCEANDEYDDNDDDDDDDDEEPCWRCERKQEKNRRQDDRDIDRNRDRDRNKDRRKCKDKGKQRERDRERERDFATRSGYDQGDRYSLRGSYFEDEIPVKESKQTESAPQPRYIDVASVYGSANQRASTPPRAGRNSTEQSKTTNQNLYNQSQDSDAEERYIDINSAYGAMNRVAPTAIRTGENSTEQSRSANSQQLETTREADDPNVVYIDTTQVSGKKYLVDNTPKYRNSNQRATSKSSGRNRTLQSITPYKILYDPPQANNSRPDAAFNDGRFWQDTGNKSSELNGITNQTTNDKTKFNDEENVINLTNYSQFSRRDQSEKEANTYQQRLTVANVYSHPYGANTRNDENKWKSKHISKRDIHRNQSEIEAAFSRDLRDTVTGYAQIEIKTSLCSQSHSRVDSVHHEERMGVEDNIYWQSDSGITRTNQSERKANVYFKFNNSERRRKSEVVETISSDLLEDVVPGYTQVESGRNLYLKSSYSQCKSNSFHQGKKSETEVIISCDQQDASTEHSEGMESQNAVDIVDLYNVNVKQYSCSSDNFHPPVTHNSMQNVAKEPKKKTKIKTSEEKLPKETNICVSIKSITKTSVEPQELEKFTAVYSNVNDTTSPVHVEENVLVKKRRWLPLQFARTIKEKFVSLLKSYQFIDYDDDSDSNCSDTCNDLVFSKNIKKN